MFLKSPHYALLLFALSMSIFDARCMLGYECKGGAEILRLASELAKQLRWGQGSRAVARNMALEFAMLRGSPLAKGCCKTPDSSNSVG